MKFFSNLKFWFKRQKMGIKGGFIYGLYHYHRLTTNMPQLVVEELRKHPADPDVWSIEAQTVRDWKKRERLT